MNLTTESAICIVPAGEGKSVWAMGEKFTFKLGAEETGGAFGLAEVIAQPRNGPPPHIHRREDELFCVLNGEFEFVVGDKVITRSSGFAAWLPRNGLHTYTNVGSRPGRMLVLYAPSGFEQFVAQWSHPVIHPAELPPPATSDDVDQLMTAAADFGIEMRPSAKAMPDASAPATEPSFWVLGQLVTVKLGRHETNGQFSVVEVLCPPGTSVLEHRHVAMDEVFYVLAGTAEFTFGDRVERVAQGGLVFVPRGEVHGFRNTGTTPVRLLDIHTPAGFEDFFREAGIPAVDPTTPPPPGPPPSPEQLQALLQRHGMELPGL